MNMDIGHIRNLTWAKDNDQKKWIAYNRLRGQYMSALEHAVPERFFNDPAQCNSYDNPTPVAGLPNCPQGISAVKALGLAAAQGQRIYTITPEVYATNTNIVNTALSAHSVDTKRRVQRALDSGMEVTIHQAPIVESGWRGLGLRVLILLLGLAVTALKEVRMAVGSIWWLRLPLHCYRWGSWLCLGPLQFWDTAGCYPRRLHLLVNIWMLSVQRLIGRQYRTGSVCS
ncbi:hypothetical protein [Delftia acidovorans]|uniref:hypothetical protein n=1 Tax=Delftia acidovorans TaxID=80866 RepID=UPI00301A00E9